MTTESKPTPEKQNFSAAPDEESEADETFEKVKKALQHIDEEVVVYPAEDESKVKEEEVADNKGDESSCL